MTNLEQSIKNALPDLMELGVGCEIYISDDHKDIGFLGEEATIINVRKEWCHVWTYYLDCITKDYGKIVKVVKSFDSQPFTILGKPITLPDVLRWMKTLRHIHLSSAIIELIIVWDLTIPNLSDQPQPVKDFLEKLKTDQK